MFPFRFLELDRAHSSWALLATLAGLGLLAGLLFYVGLVGWVLRVFSVVVRASIRQGFLIWEHLFSWASWPIFLVLVLASLGLGWAAHPFLPALTILFALAPLFMGVTACLAYMFIDLERYEVERGYKAVHNPLKGQELAAHLGQYGHQVGVPLLVTAAVGTVAGFALLNQGLYESVGEDWYAVGADRAAGPSFADFLAYALLHLLRIVDVLDLASSHRLLRVQFVREKAWPASAVLAAFKTFFTLVLLQQVFASVRQGRLLAETIADFWSPHEPIRERAQSALPQFGASVIGPLLWSLRTVSSLTKEQRDQLPLVLATLGPSAVPALVRHLRAPTSTFAPSPPPPSAICRPSAPSPPSSRSPRTTAPSCGSAWSKRSAPSPAPRRHSRARSTAGAGRSGPAGAAPAGCSGGRTGARRCRSKTPSSWPSRPSGPPSPTPRLACARRPPAPWGGSACMQRPQRPR